MTQVTTVEYDLADINLELSEQLAAATTKYGEGNCHARAKAAYKAAPKALKKNLHIVKGILHSDQGMEPAGQGEHSWLLYVEENPVTGEYDVVELVDPSVVAFFENHGVPSGLKWVLEG